MGRAKLEKCLISAILMLSHRKRVVHLNESLVKIPKVWERRFPGSCSGQIFALCYPRFSYGAYQDHP